MMTPPSRPQPTQRSQTIAVGALGAATHDKSSSVMRMIVISAVMRPALALTRHLPRIAGDVLAVAFGWIDRYGQAVGG